MRAGRFVSVAVRCAAAAAALLIAVRSARMARADWLSYGGLQSLQRAIQIEPADGSLQILEAIYRNNGGDDSSAVDRELEHAGALNPLDPNVQMTVALRAEFRGDTARAERLLKHAVELDRQFKPSWTLANFYMRHGRPGEAIPLLKHCLELEPLGFDPVPVFSLLWDATNDPAQVARLVPHRNPRLIQYLAWLVRSEHLLAAARLAPEALRVADPSSEDDAGMLRPMPALFAAGGQPAEALRMWNEMAARGIVPNAPLDPANGRMIADPEFRMNVTTAPFGWTLPESAGIFAQIDSQPEGGVARFEISGNEAESFELLRTMAAVRPGSTYRLTWKLDSKELGVASDPGFYWSVSPAGGTAVECPALAQGGSGGSCRFDTGQALLAGVLLGYRRAPGTTRPHGTLRVTYISVERTHE